MRAQVEKPGTWGNRHWTHRLPHLNPKGEERYNAKLTTLDVLTLRAFAKASPRRQKVARVRWAAKRLSIGERHAWDVVLGRRWRHLP